MIMYSNTFHFSILTAEEFANGDWGEVVVDNGGVSNWGSDLLSDLSEVSELWKTCKSSFLFDVNQSPDDILEEIQVHNLALAAVNAANQIIAEAGMLMPRKELVIDGIIAVCDGQMTIEWIDRFQDIM